MVRAGAPTPSKKKEQEGASVSAEVKAENIESKRLRDLAFSCKLLSRSKSHVEHPSMPSKTILNSDGKDIVKKGHRKNKYIFAFPGLLSPISGGKLGELTNLDSKNPVLYVEFPQGRLKLFGTIMYPKNKYLTLHFQRGAGNIVCEDCFESLIVFSQGWWIGTKEQNPEEVRLPLPEGLGQDKDSDIDFTAGAGQTKDFNRNTRHPENLEAIVQPASVVKPEVSEEESIGKDSDVQVIYQSVRQSVRNAGKSLKYADSSFDSEDSYSDEPQEILSTRVKKQSQAPRELTYEPNTNTGVKASNIGDIDDVTPKRTSAEEFAETGEKGPAYVKTVAAAAKTASKAKNGSTSVLKQSHLETFCHVDRTLKEDTNITLDRRPTMDTKAAVTTSVMKARVKSSKRPQQEYAERSHSNDEGDDFDMAKSTPSKRLKQSKGDKGARLQTATPPLAKGSSSSKVHGKQVQDGRTKTQRTSKETKSAAARVSTPKGKKAASSCVKSSKKNVDAEEDVSDPEVASDDSEDEDYVG